MSFPDSDRVIYNANPLVEVICQLRFPPVLRISTDPPAEFQDAVRDSYPILQPRQSAQALLQGSAIPQQVLSFLPNVAAGPQVYDFSSRPEGWKLTLSQDALALTANQYHRWEGFIEKLVLGTEALESVYAPAVYTRIGLRYQNLIRRSAIGLKDKSWSTLLASHVLGALSSEMAPAVQQSVSQVLYGLDEGRSVRVGHGLKEVEGEQCYIFDADFFTDRETETNHAEATLDALHKQSGRLFRWCIRDELHRAMGPTAVE